MRTMKDSKSKKKQNRVGSGLGTFVVVSCLVLLGVVVMYKAHDLVEQRTSLEAQAAELIGQLEQAKQEYAKLEEREKYMKSDAYIEEVAREQLGLIYPDEIIVKPDNSR